VGPTTIGEPPDCRQRAGEPSSEPLAKGDGLAMPCGGGEEHNMQLIVLGGTVFLGRHVVEAALTHDDEVTLFNRGQYTVDIYPDLGQLHGDRDGGLDILKGRT
jgi:hypothetical protein